MDVRAYYCIWLQNHLNEYDYHTLEAKELKQRFEKIDLKSSESQESSKSEAARCYEEFWRLLDNNPIDYELRLDFEKKYHIVPKKLEYYFVDDSNGCYIPIALYKELSHRQIERVNEAVKSYITKITENSVQKANALQIQKSEEKEEARNNYIEKIKSSSSPSLFKAFFAILISGVSIFSLYKIYSDHQDLFQKGGFGIWTIIYIALAIVVLTFTYQSIVELAEYGRMCRWRNAIEEETPQDYGAIIQASADEKDVYLIEYLKRESGEESEAVSAGRVLSKDVKGLNLSDKSDVLQRIKGDQKQLRSYWSGKKVIVYLLVMLLLVNNSGLYAIPVINQIGNFGNAVSEFKIPEFHPIKAIGNWIAGLFDGDSEDDNSAPEEVSEEALPWILVIDSNLRSEPDPNDNKNIIAVIDKGTIIDEVLDIREDTKEGTKWFQVKVNEKTGWMSRKVLKRDNPKEFSYKKIEASSELTVEGTKMVAKRAFDGYMQTTWQEASEGDGSGEWISVTLDHKGTVDYIILHNGHMKSKESFNNNNRIKKLTVETDDGNYSFEFEDEYDIEGYYLNFDTEVTTSHLKFIIDEVYKGQKSDDTCISSIQVIEK